MKYLTFQKENDGCVRLLGGSVAVLWVVWVFDVFLDDVHFSLALPPFFAARGAQAAGWPCRRRCERHRLSNSGFGVQLADSKAAFLTKYPAHLPKRHRCPCHAEALTPQYPGRARHVERGADASCSWPRSSNTFSACRRPPGATRSSQFLHRLELEGCGAKEKTCWSARPGCL